VHYYNIITGTPHIQQLRETTQRYYELEKQYVWFCVQIYGMALAALHKNDMIQWIRIKTLRW
jgi:hypothetical protein